MMDRSRIDPVHPVNPVKNEPTTEIETTEAVFIHRWEPEFHRSRRTRSGARGDSGKESRHFDSLVTGFG